MRWSTFAAYSSIWKQKDASMGSDKPPSGHFCLLSRFCLFISLWSLCGRKFMFMVFLFSLLIIFLQLDPFNEYLSISYTQFNITMLYILSCIIKSRDIFDVTNFLFAYVFILQAADKLLTFTAKLYKVGWVRRLSG